MGELHNTNVGIGWPKEKVYFVRLSISASALFVAGLFAPLGSGKVDRKPQEFLNRLKCTLTLEDPRPAKVRHFFERHGAPLADHAGEFVSAADKYRMDYRLLPAIALLETGGGRVCANYNPFGWGNGKLRFRSWRHAIHTVAETLATWKPYQGKTLDQALRVYNNEVPTYGMKVKRTMNRIDGRPVRQEWLAVY
jgi:hypothetical protein